MEREGRRTHTHTQKLNKWERSAPEKGGELPSIARSRRHQCSVTTCTSEACESDPEEKE